MNTKIMEGLVGAGLNMKIRETPMRIYKEAEREGDIGKMERAMGYANEFAGRAWEYKSETEEGMVEEAKEAEKLQQEKAEENRREKQEKQEERIEETKNKDTDTVEVSEEGKELLKANLDPEHTASVLANGNEPVIYTREGTTILQVQRKSI